MSRLTDLLTSILEPNDHTDSRPADDSGGNLGEALAKFDFGHTDLGAQGPDYSDAMPRSRPCQPPMRSIMPSARWTQGITWT